MKYRLIHTTEFSYEALVGNCYNEARLLPRALPYQTVLSSTLEIDPAPNDRFDRLDYFGNPTTYFSIQQPHEKMCVRAVSELELSGRPLPVVPTPAWESVATVLHQGILPEEIEARQYVLDSPMVFVSPELAEYAGPSFLPNRPIAEAVEDLMQRIFREFKYEPGFSTIATPLRDVILHKKGVCQDFAHLAIGCLRAKGLAARYMSGYIETAPPPGKEKMIGADASHAWFAVYIPGSGWLEFDPTNNQLPSEQHLVLAWGRDFSDVSPLKGVAYGGGEHELKVAVDVIPQAATGG